jgi:PPOX class probable F420-dependent enzyme
MTRFDQLTEQQYLNLETFRKNGVSVKTPVWFVQEGAALYVRTVANSGKVKRIRNNGQVNIAACKMDGALLGEWLSAKAREMKDEETGRKVNHLLDRKYGLMKKMFALASALQRRQYTVLEIKPGEEI